MGSMLVWKEAEEGQVPRCEKRVKLLVANAGLRVCVRERERGREQMQEWEVGVGVKVGVCLRWI